MSLETTSIMCGYTGPIYRQSLNQSIHPCFAVGSDEHLFDWWVVVLFFLFSAGRPISERRRVCACCSRLFWIAARSVSFLNISCHQASVQQTWISSLSLLSIVSRFNRFNLFQRRRSSVNQPQVRDRMSSLEIKTSTWTGRNGMQSKWDN